MAKEKSKKLIAQNKKAFHDYFIEETFQAGISLAGTEVKSLRQGKCSLKESFIRIENMEAFLLLLLLVLFQYYLSLYSPSRLQVLASVIFTGIIVPTFISFPVKFTNLFVSV